MAIPSPPPLPPRFVYFLLLRMLVLFLKKKNVPCKNSSDRAFVVDTLINDKVIERISFINFPQPAAANQLALFSPACMNTSLPINAVACFSQNICFQRSLT